MQWTRWTASPLGALYGRTSWASSALALFSLLIFTRLLNTFQGMRNRTRDTLTQALYDSGFLTAYGIRLAYPGRLGSSWRKACVLNYFWWQKFWCLWLCSIYMVYDAASQFPRTNWYASTNVAAVHNWQVSQGAAPWTPTESGILVNLKMSYEVRAIDGCITVSRFLPS